MIRTLRSVILSCLVAAVLSAGIVFAFAPPRQTYLPALTSPGTFPVALAIPADYVIDGVDPVYLDGSLYVAVQTVSGTKGHPKVAVVFHETGLRLTPILTVTAIYGAPSLLLTPDGRLLVAGSDREHELHLVEVPRSP